MNSSFYVTLPSNVFSFGHEKNVTSEYTTYLPKALELDKDLWEVAMVEIAYPHSFDNIHAPFDTVKFTFRDTETNEGIRHLGQIDNGYYGTIDSLLQAINKCKPKGFKGNFAREKLGRQHVKIVLFPFEEVKLHKTLATLLGFHDNSWIFNPSEIEGDPPERTRIKAKFQGDLRALHYNIYVYSDIVQPHLVGSTYLPLLRTVHIEGTSGSYISKVYEVPHYLPLSSSFIEKIQIKITDDLSQNIRFMYGKVIVKLHFRRKPLLQQ